MDLSAAGVPGWRLSVLHTAERSAVLDALARTEAAFLRTGRGRAAEAAGHLRPALHRGSGLGVRRFGGRGG